MLRRSGWLALAGVAVLVGVASAAGLAWQLFVAVRDGKPAAVVLASVVGAMVLGFWALIGLGAWYRANPPIDDETGEPVARPEVGPWGRVGRVLTVAVLAGLVAVGIWATTAGRRSDQAAQRVRVRADRTARQAGITVDKVSQARSAFLTWSTTQDPDRPTGPSPLDQLLPVPGAEVVDAAVDPSHAALLLRPDEGPPCVVVDVDEADVVTTRLTRRC